MERKVKGEGRGGKALAEKSEEDDSSRPGPGDQRQETPSQTRTLQGATAKLQGPLVSPAVGYRIEGGGLSDEDMAASCSSSSPSEAVIDDVFDLEGKDNDYKYYQTNFVNKGAPLRLSHWPGG